MKFLLFAAFIALIPASCDKIPAYTIPYDDLSEHIAVACPSPEKTFVIVTGGQSNAGNHLTFRTSTKITDNVYAFYNGQCYIAQDPMPGASGTRGSLWPLLGQQLAQRTGKSIVLISAARGGASYEDWLNPQTRYMSDLLRQLDNAETLGFTPDWIIWHQGETNARTPEHARRNKDELTRLTSILLDEMPHARMYMFRVSRCSDKINMDGIPLMRDIQTQVAAQNPRIIAGMNTDELDSDYRMDRCHFNRFARDIIAERVTYDLSQIINSDQ